jgi:hypothetical protein
MTKNHMKLQYPPYEDLTILMNLQGWFIFQSERICGALKAMKFILNWPMIHMYFKGLIDMVTWNDLWSIERFKGRVVCGGEYVAIIVILIKKDAF